MYVGKTLNCYVKYTFICNNNIISYHNNNYYMHTFDQFMEDKLQLLWIQKSTIIKNLNKAKKEKKY